MYILETERLYLRKITEEDYLPIAAILQDIEVMYAWEHAFSEQEVIDWIAANIRHYASDGYSYWAAIEKSSGRLIGVTGLIAEKAEHENYLGLGYIFYKSFWHQGFALEAARACVDYAFKHLPIDEITAQIRPNNLSSCKLAEKLGMTIKKKFIKHYKGKDMEHLLYSLSRL